MQHTGFTSAQDALAFIAGGNAKLTLTSAATGEHFTYQIKQGWDGKAHKRDHTTPYFVSVLTSGADDYMYIGFLPQSAPTKLVAGKKGHPDAPSFEVLRWSLAHLAQGRIPEQLTIQHSGSCCVCGRELTEPTSIASGIGPVCAVKG